MNRETFSETDYLAANPDVASAVARGDITSGWDHFERFGRNEGRPGVQHLSATRRPIFFCHIPKTAGTAIRLSMERTVAPYEIMPDIFMMKRNAGRYPLLADIETLVAAQRKAIRLFRGHYALSARDLIPGCLTVTVLREPVARSISHLRHMIQDGFAGRDEVLDMLDAGAYPAGSDMQTRMLSDPYLGGSWTLFRRDWPPLEADALERALAALPSIDVLGVTEAMADFAARLEKATGIALDQARHNQALDEIQFTERQIETVRLHNANDAIIYQRACQMLGYQT